jgi:hypothetical protein
MWFRLIKQDDFQCGLFDLKINRKNKNIMHSQCTLRRCSFVSEGRYEIEYLQDMGLSLSEQSQINNIDY